MNDLPATYDVILYGPSESVCWRNWALSGTYFMYSTGRAEQKPIVRMYRKSGVELSRWNVSVEVVGRDHARQGVRVDVATRSPDAVPFTLAKPVQYAFIPTIVSVK